MSDTTIHAPRAAAGTRDDHTPLPGRVALLAAGDLIALLLFVVIGRSNHQESRTLGDIAATAAPFVLGWFAVSPWLGAFGRRGSAATTRPRALLPRTALAWAVAGPVALLLRALVFQGGDAPAFIAVALIFNAVFLLGWRGIVSWLLWRR